MKISFLAAASSIHTVRWVNTLADKGHEVVLITMHPQEENKISNKVKVHELKYKGRLGYYLNVSQVKDILKSINPDILNVHYASGYGTLGRLTKFHPMLLSVWGSDVYEYPYRNKLAFYNIKKNILSADAVASTSWDMRRQTFSIAPNLKKDVFITPFGINLDLFKPLKIYKDPDIIKIGIVKTLEEIYGVKYLIEAFAKVLEYLPKTDFNKQLLLEIVADGSQKESLQNLCEQLNISDKVEFSGKIPNTLVPEKLNTFDIYCAPSLSESFGVAVIEASACELPVIVTNVGGLKEVVEHRKTGIIVESENVEQLSEAILELVLDDNKRLMYGKYGRRFVKEHFNWNNNVIVMEEIYTMLINKSRRKGESK